MPISFLRISSLVIFVLLFSSIASRSAQSKTVANLLPLSSPNTNWILQPDFSDEFNAEKLDLDIWNNTMHSWGGVSWDSENVYLQHGYLHLKMQYKGKIRRNKKKLYYSSGIVRTKKAIKYGYFEARMKGANRAIGVNSAFWAFKRERDKWTEIDFVELTKDKGGPMAAGFNKHVFYHPNTPKRKKGNHLRGHRHIFPSWDPVADYHVYGCEWNRKEIKWFIDGYLVESMKNNFLDQPLNVILALGLRRPLRNNPSRKDFPTEMTVDYVRVWEKCTSGRNGICQ